MTENSIVKSVLGFAAAACVMLAFVFFDADVRSQNANSSTTTQEEDANANANTGENTNADAEANTNTTPRRGRGRRGRRGTRMAPADNTNTSQPAEGNVEGETPQRPEIVINPGSDMTQDTSGGTQEDLSGAFTGRVTMTGGHEMSGAATLTITGNTFTLESEGMTHSGRIYAINTRRYIGAALIFTDLTDPATNTPLAVSVRARRTGNRLSLTPVPGARNRMTFNGRSS